MQCEPAKMAWRSDNGVTVASPMIKSAMERKKKKKVEIVGIAYLFL